MAEGEVGGTPGDGSAPARLDLVELVALAATLGERCRAAVGQANGLHPPGPSPPGERSAHDRAASRLDRWAETVARGDRGRLAVRLELDDLDEGRALAILGEPAAIGPRSDGTGPLPDWAVLLAEGLDRLGDADLATDRSLPDPGQPPVPLQELVVPFVRAARARVEDRVRPGGALALIAPPALAALERELLTQLSWALTPAGELELRAWRRPRVDPLAEALARASGSPGRALYDEWVAGQRAGGLAGLLARYPAAARLLGVIAAGWVEAVAEFLGHLQADAAALEATFGPAGHLVEVGGASSDPHHGRRRVVGCRFESGLALVYKPHSLRTEVLYGELLDWCNEHGADPVLRRLQVLDRGDHGWVERVAQAPVADAEAATRYYRRVGTVLALLYALGANDCHRENLIAAGEDPMVVDAETLLHPRLAGPLAAGADEWNAARQAAGIANASVLGVGLLPVWVSVADGRQYDMSGLGAVEAQEAPNEVPGWELPNTDVARLVPRRPTIDATANVMVLGGRPQRPEDYLDAIGQGFADGYRLLCRGRDELLAPGGLLEAFDEAPIRVLFRPTRLYGLVLRSAQQPRWQGGGVDYSIELERLARPIVEGLSPPSHFALWRSEQGQLEAADIPRFEVRGADRSLRLGPAEVPFDASATETAREKLGALGEEDLELQLELIRTGLGPPVDPRRVRPPARPQGRPDPDRPGVEQPGADRPDPTGPGPAWHGADSRGALVAAAAELAAGLERSAIRSGEGVAWVGLSLDEQGARWTVRPTAFDLYAGLPGIALFLAGLARVTGEARWQALAIACLLPPLEEAERRPDRLALAFGEGGAAGVGGLLYALSLTAEVSGSERPLQAAHRLVQVLAEVPGSSQPLDDLLGGSAGLVAGLLALDRVSGGAPAALAAAVGVGRRLAGRATDPAGQPEWEGTLRGHPLDGAAHGTAGIAGALSLLARRTGDEALGGLAARALAGESARYDPALGGWEDRRRDTGRHAGNAWCYGTAGIGLSRLALTGPGLADPLREVIERDLARVRRAVLGSPEPIADHLCCGGAGACELLLELAQRRHDAEAGTAAAARLDRMAGRILGGEGVRLNRQVVAPDRRVPSPGLFQGTSGVGWALLRGACPELPSVLSWC